MKTRVIAAVMAMALAASVAMAEDWPQWRGPRGDGISQEKNLLEAIPAEGLTQKWSVAVGQGYSSPVVVDGKIYIISMENKKDVLRALDAATGKEIWKQELPGGWSGGYPGSRATPVVEKDRIYVYSGNSDLSAHNLATGKPVWTINILKETGGKNLTWGVSSSPLLTGKGIVVQGGRDGAAAVAVDKATGKIAWKSELVGGGYAMPIMIDDKGTKQLIVFGGNALAGVDPANGKTLWQHPWPTAHGVNASTPIYHDGKLFVTSGYNQGAMMLDMKGKSAEKIWEKKDVQSQFQGTVLDDGVLYFNNYGTLGALQWPEQKVLWTMKANLGAGGSFVRQGDKLWVLSDSGKLLMLKATAAGVEKLGEMQAFQGKEIWATPVISGGTLFVKGPTDLVAYDVSK